MSTNVDQGGWRLVQPGERVVDIHAAIGAVVRECRREGVEVVLDDDVIELAVAAMKDVLMALDVTGMPMRWDEYVVV